MTDPTHWRTVFEQTYGQPPSPIQARIWRAVLGDEYPEGLDPYSYTSRSELRRIANDLHVAHGDTLLDVGCGRGGAGLWVAMETGADLVGIDIAEAALDAARERATRLAVVARFQRGEFEATGLESGSVDGVMSIDALLFTLDKTAAMRELRRVLRPGGRLCLTSWDYHSQPVGRPPQVPDHRPIAEAAGFEVVDYDETDDWRSRQSAIGQGLLDASDELAAEEGVSQEEMRAGIEEMVATGAAMTRRFLLVAEAR